MSSSQSAAANRYVPLYFLASLGAGGLAVTFFMYLMFWVPHPAQPVPVFEDILAAFQTGPVPLKGAILVAWIGIALFAFLNLRLLAFNVGALSRFAKTDAYHTLRSSNAESSLLAAPLAAAMSVNVMFILGMVFVPGLWGVVEYLFPMAIVAFSLIGVWALRLIASFLGRVLSAGGAFDMAAHNSFAQLMPAFALSMIGVGFAAPAAMSTTPATVGIALIGSSFFGTAGALYALTAGISAISAMLKHGTAREAAPTLMVIVPIITVLGILWIRQSHGLHTTFDAHGSAGATMVALARLLTIQILFILLGAAVLRRQGYFQDFVIGTKLSAGSYALVCPGVALAVMIHFFANKGLVASGMIDKFGVAYWGVTAFALLAQVLMIALVLRLNRQHFTAAPSPKAVPAE